ncbi:unnamed protein product [Allacma fusca]|uniref:PiggyBac transposable element-derived protein domain-containing protein n=1 Tax=Allacma fusca TaxID=39272 RepID=A0A8J2PM61_9HEXA|nr:unnamed protein product [Allacma fusca]
MVTRFVPKQNRGVFIISSSDYSHEAGEVSEEVTKPPVVEKYNQSKYGVDVVDEMIASYYAIFPTKRWPVRLFLHLVHTVAYNAYKLFILKFPNWRSNDRSKRRIALRELVRLLIIPHILRRRRNLTGIHLQVRRSWDIVLNLPVVHGEPDQNVFPMGPDFDQEINPTPTRKLAAGGSQHQRTRRRCEICAGNCDQRKISDVQCCRCKRFVCGDHRFEWCDICTNLRY